MEFCLLSHEVSDLCLGKPALRSLPITATIAQALFALKQSEDRFISVWSCDHRNSQSKNHFLDTRVQTGTREEIRDQEEGCRCIGKVCMVDVICYLAKEENILSPSTALESPVSVLLPERSLGLVVHVEPNSSLLEAIDLILQGAQNIVVPIKTSNNPFSRRKHTNHPNHHNREFCWLTTEDILRYFLGSIGLFSHIASVSVADLGIITVDDIAAVNYHSSASSAIAEISKSLAEQTSVAVVDDYGVLIGEISPVTLSCCDESVAAAIATLSIGELMSYIDCGGPPDDLIRVVDSRLQSKNLEKKMCEEFENRDFSNNSLTRISSNIGRATSRSLSLSSSSSSDDESSLLSPTTVMRSPRLRRLPSYSSRMVRISEAIVCNHGSSLVAVMIQAMSHRVSYVWVIAEDSSLVGIVTFSSMVRILREHLQSLA